MKTGLSRRFLAVAAGAAALAISLAAGCSSGFLPLRDAGRSPPELRFVTRADLGVSETPLALDVVFTINPRVRLDPASARWEKPDVDLDFDALASFRSLTQNVLSQVFRTAVEVAPGGHSGIEELRRGLPAQATPADVPALKAKALVLVDFRPPQPDRLHLPPQLAVEVYDISYSRYEALSLFSPRLLIFEDFAEVEVPQRRSRLPGALVPAWREVLGRMRSSDRFRRYLALGREPLDDRSPEGAFLLGIISPEQMKKVPDPRGHEWIEREFFFPRPPPPSAAPPPAVGRAPAGNGAKEGGPSAREEAGSRPATPPPPPVFVEEPSPPAPGPRESPPKSGGAEAAPAPVAPVAPPGEVK